MHTRVYRFAFVLFFVAIGYLSLKPDPRIEQVLWIPGPMAQWFDRHDEWKNLVGFGAWGLLGFLAWPLGLEIPQVSPRNRRVLLGLVFFLVLVVLEGFQTRLQNRSCDPRDIVAGALGIVLAALAAKWTRRHEGADPKITPADSSPDSNG